MERLDFVKPNVVLILDCCNFEVIRKRPTAARPTARGLFAHAETTDFNLVLDGV